MASSILYIKTDNCKIVLGEKNKLIRTSGSDIRDSEEEYKVDDRLYIYSVNNTMDIEEYSNYYETYMVKANKEVSMASATGRFVTLLDMGYIPVWTPPTFFTLESTEDFANKLDAKGIVYTRRYPMRIRGDRAGSELTDVWCTRKEVARVLGTTIDNISVMTFLKEVMK